MSKPFRPCSSSVGTLGNCGARLSDATAIALTLPCEASGAAVEMLSIVMTMWPPSRSVMTGAAPRYAACGTFTPILYSMVSAIRWLEMPTPAVPYVAVGVFWKYSLSSARLLAGTSLLTMTTLGCTAASVIGVKSDGL
ncbi:hypothetical protein D3C72_1672350 [compost metagenome]